MPRWKYINWKERFFDKINIFGVWNEQLNSYCWNWVGGMQTDGYGSMGMKDGETGKWSNWPAHRVSWYIHFGELPKYPEYEICHKCDNRLCVNPEHLFVAPHADNIRDMFKKNRSYNRKGENNPKAKLTREDVDDIRYFYRLGATRTELAKAYEVSTTNIRGIVLNQIWRL